MNHYVLVENTNAGLGNTAIG